MPATIHVTGGRSNGQRYWIEGPVIRIGSDPSANLTIPEADAHCVTLQYRDGTYWLFNRGGEKVKISGQQGTPTAPVALAPGVMVEVARKVGLRLEVEGSPAPSPAPKKASKGFGDEIPDDSEAAVSVEKTISIAQCAILAFLGVLMVAMLLDTASGSDSRSQTHQRYEETMDDLQSLGQDAPQAQLSQLIRQARYYEVRKDYDQAMRLYQQSRDILTKDSLDGESPVPFHQSAYDFICERINALQPRTSSGPAF